MTTKTKSILVIHGPNLNLLGVREPEIYGNLTLDSINKTIAQNAKKLRIHVTCAQSNHEGEIVELIQNAPKKYSGLVINAAAYTHTSVAIRDALAAISIPKVEVHISNIYRREDFRHHSVTAAVCNGQISGLGVQGYVLAMEYIASL